MPVGFQSAKFKRIADKIMGRSKEKNRAKNKNKEEDGYRSQGQEDISLEREET